MSALRILPWGLIGALSLTGTLMSQQPPLVGPPGRPVHVQPSPLGRKTTAVQEEQPKLSQRVDWAKGLSHAERLMTLSQQVHAQIQAGPKKIPANLKVELKEIEKLTKQVRSDLGY